MLARLEKKGVLASTARARERFYRPLVTEGEVRRSMVSDLVSTLFKGDPTEQGRKLMTMIGTAVANLHQLHTIVPTVQDLEPSH
jgi:predicted transcriptional regulator